VPGSDIVARMSNRGRRVVQHRIEGKQPCSVQHAMHWMARRVPGRRGTRDMPTSSGQRPDGTLPGRGVPVVSHLRVQMFFSEPRPASASLADRGECPV